MSRLHAEYCERYGDDFADFDINYDAPIPFRPVAHHPTPSPTMTYLKAFADEFARGHGITADQFFNEVRSRPEARAGDAYAYAAGALKARYTALQDLFGHLLKEYGQVCQRLDALDRAVDCSLDKKNFDRVQDEFAGILEELEVPTLAEIEA
jgi:hypothetical protein